MATSTAAWECDIQADPGIDVDFIDDFNARGMKRVYVRGDYLGGSQPVFNLDIWKTKDGRLLARLWSRGSQVDNESFEVLGFGDRDFPKQDERWVPQVIRRRYDNWILSMMSFC